jgi:hypothetical protein
VADEALGPIVMRALERFLSVRLPREQKGRPGFELDHREREVARAFQALPVLRDMVETIYLRPDGTFFAWDNDTAGQTTLVRELDADGSNRTCLLVWGSRRHPELSALAVAADVTLAYARVHAAERPSRWAAKDPA